MVFVYWIVFYIFCNSIYGGEDGWAFIRRVTFRGQSDGNEIKAIGLRDGVGIFYDTEKYNPKDIGEFLVALDGVLAESDWYLLGCNFDITGFRGHARVYGNLHSYNQLPRDEGKRD
ncbi:MAG: hypothetical protein KKB31_03795 [Nanoarchaeota archaeon]|nr:hypothetical protein [Nanoarchaeota archaeon]